MQSLGLTLVLGSPDLKIVVSLLVALFLKTLELKIFLVFFPLWLWTECFVWLNVAEVKMKGRDLQVLVPCLKER